MDEPGSRLGLLSSWFVRRLSRASCRFDKEAIEILGTVLRRQVTALRRCIVTSGGYRRTFRQHLTD